MHRKPKTLSMNSARVHPASQTPNTPRSVAYRRIATEEAFAPPEMIKIKAFARVLAHP